MRQLQLPPVQAARRFGAAPETHGGYTQHDPHAVGMAVSTDLSGRYTSNTRAAYTRPQDKDDAGERGLDPKLGI